MKMKMLVRVDMIQRQTSGIERSELRLDFRRKLTAHPGQEEKAESVTRHSVAETAGRIDQIGNFRARQHGWSVRQNHM